MKLYAGHGFDSSLYCWHDDADRALEVMAEHLGHQHNVDTSTCRDVIEVAWEADQETERAISELLGREHGTCLITIP